MHSAVIEWHGDFKKLQKEYATEKFILNPEIIINYESILPEKRQSLFPSLKNSFKYVKNPIVCGLIEINNGNLSIQKWK